MEHIVMFKENFQILFHLIPDVSQVIFLIFSNEKIYDNAANTLAQHTYTSLYTWYISEHSSNQGNLLNVPTAAPPPSYQVPC